MWATEKARETRRLIPLPAPVELDIFIAALNARHVELELDPAVLGMTVRSRDLWIVTQKGLSGPERRLTVLHEGGHIVMHTGNCIYLRNHDAMWEAKAELAADVFAAEYGIPDALVRACRDAFELSEVAELPERICQLRLELAGRAETKRSPFALSADELDERYLIEQSGSPWLPGRVD